MKTKYSISTSSLVGSQRLEMDLEERRRPYSLEDEFVEGRRSIIHKRRSELLIFGDSVRKCREDNERNSYPGANCKSYKIIEDCHVPSRSRGRDQGTAAII